MKNIFKVTFVIWGAIIGAGFISGQEINLFFNKFGKNGIIGILIAGLLMVMTIKKVCIKIYKDKIQNYQGFIDKTIPIDNIHIKLIMNNIITVLLLISFWIMCAAFNAYFKQEFQIPIWLIGTINCLLCYLILKNNSKAVIKINQILIPVIILAIIFLIFKQIPIKHLYETSMSNSIVSAILSGIVYASYNIVLLIPILVTLSKYLESEHQISIISIISGCIIIIIAVIVYFLLYTVPNIEDKEIPLIYIANNLGSLYHYIYGAVIVVAIFTTAISVGHGFLKNVTKTEKSYRRLALSIGITSIVISYVGFSNLVSYLYPLTGIIGLVQIIFILKP